jgi:poly-gamma-glutamate capsule biosynthesis protein CapA/YwtB (metallophosphatase superfamily)
MNGGPLRLFLSGDVMTGRGIDQIQSTPGDPRLYESWAKSAIHYVELAERRYGAIPRGVGPEYVWGEALGVLDEAGVDARIINLETAVTDRGEPWPAKGIHYRMHPDNVAVLAAAGIDCCVLANNHILDWSYPGLAQTLDSLHGAGIITAGAGIDNREARRPAIIETGVGSRVVVLAVGTGSSGIPISWSAADDRAGVWLLRSFTGDSVADINAAFDEVRQPGDIAVVSIHWGPNWGYAISEGHRRFAHALIDEAGVDIVHGHSSHHPIGVEIYRDRPILYGCGDLINDYEGIGGHDEVRPDLGVLYLATLTHTGLKELDMIPMRLHRFRLERAERDDSAWLARTLTRASRPFGTRFEDVGDGRLRVLR